MKQLGSLKRAGFISHRGPHVPEQAPHEKITLPATLKRKDQIQRNYF